MERELTPELKQIQQNIKQILINSKIEITPLNMINYTAQTILQLDNDVSINNLYSVLFVYKDFITVNDLLLKLIVYHINTLFQDKAIRLVKILLNNDKHSLYLFKNLLDVFYKTNLLKIRKTLELFNIKEEYANSLLDNNDFIRFYNLYFNELIEKIDFKNRIFLNTKYAYNLLLKYTKFIINGPIIDEQSLCENNINIMLSINNKNKKIEKSLEEKVTELQYVIKMLLSNKEYEGYENTILKMINEILEFNNIHFLKTKEHLFELSKDFKDLINDILINKNTELKLAQDFFSINRAFIVPQYIFIIRNITSEKLLQHIVSVVDVEILNQIIKLDTSLLRFSTNNDISLFLELYQKDNKILSIMPTFLDFCTDHQNIFTTFYDFIYSKLSTDFFVVCTTLRNILRSHELNLKKDVILRNMIPKETSKKIINEITNLDLFNKILDNYQFSGVVNDLLFSISKYLQGLENYNDFTRLHLFKFYIPGMNLNIEIISKVLEGCRVKSEDQKRYYEILYYFEKYNKINIDICSDLYGLDMLNNLQLSSLKWRLQYLFLRQKNGCCKKSDYCKINFLNALFSSFHLGNKSCKDVCEDILEDLMLSKEYKILILRFIEENIKNNDINIRCGCLISYNIILRNNIIDCHPEKMKEIYKYLFLIYKEINALIIINLFTSFVLYTEDIVTNDLEDVIEYYIDSKKKKYRKDIKNLISLIISKKLFNLNRKIKQYYKFKIKTEHEEIILKKK